MGKYSPEQVNKYVDYVVRTQTQGRKDLTPEQIKAYADHVRQNAEITYSDGIQEEQHPDITAIDRMTVKNLSNAPEEGSEQNVAYLKKQHPGLDVRSYKGRIIARRPGEGGFKVLDPDTGFFSKDFLGDVGDVAVDLGRAPIEAGAAALGALGGPAAPVTVPALSGAASGMLETLRQGAGQAMGVNKNIDVNDVKTDAAMGAAIPVLGRLGKAGYNFGTRTALPFVGEWASGIPRDVIRTTMNRLPEIDALDHSGLTEAAKSAQQRIVDPIQKALAEKGRALGKRITDSGGKVATAPIVAPLDNLIAEYETKMKSGVNNPELQQAYEELKAAREKLFQDTKPKKVDYYGGYQQDGPDVTGPLSEHISPEAAFDLQTQIRNASDAHLLGNVNPAISARTQGKSIPNKRLIGAYDESAQAVNDALAAATEQTKTVTEPGKRSVMDFIMRRDAEPVTKTVTTSSQDLKDELKQLYDMRRNLSRHFGTEQQTYDSLTNRSKKSKRIMADTLEQAKKLGVNVDADTDLFRANEYMGEPPWRSLPWSPTSGSGTTSTSRSAALTGVGALLGNKFGQQMSDDPDERSYLGAALGASAGAALGSPAALKLGIRGIRAGERAGRAANPWGLTGDVGPYATWHLLEGEDPSSLAYDKMFPAK